QAGDAHPLVVVEGNLLVIDDLHLDPRNVRLGESGIDHVGRLDIAPAFELHPITALAHLLAHCCHGPVGPCRGPADIVAIDRGGAPVEPLVGDMAHKAQADVLSLPDLVHEPPQPLGITVGHNGVPVLEQDRSDQPGRRVIDLGDRFGAAILRTELRLVVQLLELVIVPELDLDAPVHDPPLGGVVGGHRVCSSLAVAFENYIGPLQGVVDCEGYAPGHRLRQPRLVAVDALVAPFQRAVVAEGDEPDDDIPLAAQIDKGLPDLLLEIFRHRYHGCVVVHGGDQVPDADAMGLAFLVAHLADRLGAADLDPAHLPRDDYFLFHHLIKGLVVPDFDFHPAVLRP